jgi:hypothetical protein
MIFEANLKYWAFISFGMFKDLGAVVESVSIKDQKDMTKRRTLD